MRSIPEGDKKTGSAGGCDFDGPPESPGLTRVPAPPMFKSDRTKHEDTGMSAARDRLVREAASRGKYAPLYRHLSARAGSQWRASFGEVESILGFGLPDSARLYRPWWSNQKKDGGHSHALAWQAAGWKTREVDLEAESLVFVRAEEEPAVPAGTEKGKTFDLDEFWPAIPGGAWPAGFAVSREQIYDEAGRLTGGPEDDTDDALRDVS